MKKLTKEQVAEKQHLVALLESKRSTIENTTTELNEKLTGKQNEILSLLQDYKNIIEDGKTELEPLVEDFNETVGKANEFCADVQEAIEAYVGERSEKWQEGETAERYSAWSSDWDVSFSEMDPIEPDEMEDIDFVEFEFTEDVVENFSALPEELE